MALNNLGVALAALGRHAEAEAALRGALAADANDAEALSNLGAALHAQGAWPRPRPPAAGRWRSGPTWPSATRTWATSCRALGRPDEAEACHRRAVEFQPRLPAAWRGLAALLRRRGRPADAVQALGHALGLSPRDAGLRVLLADALLELNRPGEAEAACREALLRAPNDADAHNGLGNALSALGRLDEADACYREAARLRPGWSVPVYNRGVAVQGQGRLAEARACFAEALRLDPSNHVAHSTFVGSLLFDPDAGGERLLAEGRRWAEAHAPSPQGPVTHPNTPDPSRRLRVGYVSPDFRSHAVAFFLGPVLAQHDPDAVEVFCYADVAAPDETTAGLRHLGHAWHGPWGLTDDEVEAQVRQDGIDVLVDLGGHLAHNRLRSLRPSAGPGPG